MTGPNGCGEPSWCAGHSETPTGQVKHQSRLFRAGDGSACGRGQVAVWLERTGTGETVVGVNAGHMTSVAVEVSLDDARRHRNHLDVLLGLADSDQAAGTGPPVGGHRTQ